MTAPTLLLPEEGREDMIAVHQKETHATLHHLAAVLETIVIVTLLHQGEDLKTLQFHLLGGLPATLMARRRSNSCLTAQ
jgi:hypothetical protein